MVSLEFSGKKVYRKVQEIVSRRIADEMFIVPIRGRLADMKQIFIVPEVAEFIWNHLDGEKTLKEILDEINETYDVGKKQAEEDLKEFIDELLEAGLIEEAK
jgi:hypothetical protein